MQHPSRMPLYALMAATGSTLGCIFLYFIARKGGEAFFHSRAGKHGGAIRHWIERNGFGGMLAAALLPPPTPFKFFVFAAGVFEMPLTARLFRYFGVGYLAVRYGDGALPFLQRHKLNVALAAVFLVAVSYGLSQLILRAKHPYGDAAHKKRGD